MKDIRPYMLQAYYQWLDDSNKAPHIVCKNGPNVQWPAQFKDQDVLLFNISSESIKDFHVDEKGVSFRARFNTVEHHIFNPLNSILQLRSQDGEFAFNFALQPEPEKEEIQEKLPVKERPKLTLVKG